MRLIKNNNVFSYQCRYCKETFDQWEKLVGHRTNVHRAEFEALKKAAQLLGKGSEQGIVMASGKAEGSVTSSKVNGDDDSNLLQPEVPSQGLVPWPNGMILSSPRTPSKEVDARDLENQELQLYVPSNSNSQPVMRSSLTVPSFGGGAAASPPESFYIGSINKCHYSPFIPPYLSPPLTPPSSAATSLTGITGEIVLNMNWIVPHSKKAVIYHDLNDDDEIEICMGMGTAAQTPTTPQISVKKHETSPDDDYCGPAGHSGEIERFQGNLNHVVVENLDDEELQMTCNREPLTPTFRNAERAERPASAGTENNNNGVVQIEVLRGNSDRRGIINVASSFNNSFARGRKRLKVIGLRKPFSFTKRRIFCRKSFHSSRLRLQSRAFLMRSRRN